jgi:hypothetical protein
MMQWIENLFVTIFALASTIFLYKKTRINFTYGKNFSILAVVMKIKKKKKITGYKSFHVFGEKPGPFDDWSFKDHRQWGAVPGGLFPLKQVKAKKDKTHRRQCKMSPFPKIDL